MCRDTKMPEHGVYGLIRVRLTTLQDRGIHGDTVYREKRLGDGGFNKKEGSKCLQSRCSINAKGSDSYIKHFAGCPVHRQKPPLITTVLPPPFSHHLLHPGQIMRNTSSSFPPPKRKAVPYARNPLFSDLGRTGSPLSPLASG